MTLKAIGRDTFAVAVDARIELISKFGAMGAIVGRFCTHDDDSKLIKYRCRFDSFALASQGLKVEGRGTRLWVSMSPHRHAIANKNNHNLRALQSDRNVA